MKKESLTLVIIIFISFFISSAYFTQREEDKKKSEDKEITTDSLPTISYAEHIQPIWDKYCISCHNVDNDEVSIALTSDYSYKYLSHYGYFKPKKPEKSYLYEVSTGETRTMPPSKSNNEGLTPEEEQLLYNWIAQGGLDN